MVGVIWKWIYEADDGLLNAFLGLFQRARIPWLEDERLVLVSLAVMSAWKGVGYSMMILLAGLRAIPSLTRRRRRSTGRRPGSGSSNHAAASEARCLLRAGDRDDRLVPGLRRDLRDDRRRAGPLQLLARLHAVRPGLQVHRLRLRRRDRGGPVRRSCSRVALIQRRVIGRSDNEHRLDPDAPRGTAGHVAASRRPAVARAAAAGTSLDLGLVLLAVSQRCPSSAMILWPCASRAILFPSIPDRAEPSTASTAGARRAGPAALARATRCIYSLVSVVVVLLARGAGRLRLRQEAVPRQGDDVLVVPGDADGAVPGRRSSRRSSCSRSSTAWTRTGG